MRDRALEAGAEDGGRWERGVLVLVLLLLLLSSFLAAAEVLRVERRGGRGAMRFEFGLGLGFVGKVPEGVSRCYCFEVSNQSRFVVFCFSVFLSFRSLRRARERDGKKITTRFSLREKARNILLL